MKKLNNLLFFIFFFAVTVIVWFSLFNSDENVENQNKLSSQIENIRSLGIADNPVEIRRAVEIPENIKEDMQNILNRIKQDIEDNSNSYSASELVEIVKLFGSFGERVSFSSSTIFKLLEISAESNNVSSMYFQSLLALVRVTKTPESAESFLMDRCLKESQSTDLDPYSCIALRRLNISIPETISDNLKIYSKAKLESTGKIIDSWIKGEGIIVENMESLITPLCLIAPILDGVQLDRLNQLYTDIIKSNLEAQIKVLMLNCSIDMASKKPEILDAISHTMQFDSDKNLRKEALLELLHIGSERSLELAKAYGHKFINGEAPPEVIIPHPFREWAISNNLKTNSSQ